MLYYCITAYKDKAYAMQLIFEKLAIIKFGYNKKNVLVKGILLYPEVTVKMHLRNTKQCPSR